MMEKSELIAFINDCEPYHISSDEYLDHKTQRYLGGNKWKQIPDPEYQIHAYFRRTGINGYNSYEIENKVQSLVRKLRYRGFQVRFVRYASNPIWGKEPYLSHHALDKSHLREYDLVNIKWSHYLYSYAPKVMCVHVTQRLRPMPTLTGECLVC